MPLSARTRRLRLYSYTDTGSDGRREQTFVKQANSSADDGDWWGSLVAPGGREVNIAAQKGYSVDAVIGLGPAAPVTSVGLVKDVATGAIYKVTAVLPRDIGRDEQQVMGERVDEAEYQLDDFVAGWRANPNIVLLAEARGQDTTQQIVRSTIGPDGWLGDSPATTTNDPTYASDHDRFVMGEVSGRGVNFGDVLGATLDSADGFTVVTPVEVALSGPVVIWQKFDLGAGIEGPLLHVPTSGFMGAAIHYEGGTTDIDFVSSLASVVAAGKHVLGYHFDRTLARTARHGFWLDGAPVTLDAVFQLGSGDDSLSVATPGAPFWLGGPNTATAPAPKVPPVSAPAIVVAKGVLPVSWHADFYAESVARGWV